jgi:uncharacterized protein
LLGYNVSGLSFESILLAELSGPAIFTGGEYGFEGSIICTLILFAAFVAACYLENKIVK